MSTPVPDTCVSKVPLFTELSAQEQWEVASYARPIRRTAGEAVQIPGTSSPRLLVVHKGRVKVSRVLSSGKEQVLRTLGPGDFHGEIAFITGDPVENVATAMSKVEICSFDHADLAELIREYPAIGQGMLSTVAHRLQDAERSLTSVTGADVESRLAGYLLDAPARRIDGEMVVKLPVPKKTLASLLGTSPETLSRRFASLTDAGVLRVRGPHITIVDPLALEDRAPGS